MEIDGARAWCRLTAEHPYLVADGAAGGGSDDLAGWFGGFKFYEPYWPAVAEHYDVIHLTQLAYLECAYAPLECIDGITSITGWGPDVAVWLIHPTDISGAPI
ncbi:MAG: hypothetical protein Q4G35_02380 [Propionibacteriaceae bacterium]|nr:hypothetical protein [Propionibacteriaceae bacterium]